MKQEDYALCTSSRRAKYANTENICEKKIIQINLPRAKARVMLRSPVSPFHSVCAVYFDSS